MLRLNYYTHLLLNYKHKTFIYFVLISLIIYILKNESFALCMTNEEAIVNDAPVVAEVKELQESSHQVLAIKHEIMEYANLQTPLLKQIEDQNIEITVLQDKNIELEARNKYLNSELRAYVDEEILHRMMEERIIEEERSSEEYEDTFRRGDDIYQS